MIIIKKVYIKLYNNNENKVDFSIIGGYSSALAVDFHNTDSFVIEKKTHRNFKVTKGVVFEMILNIKVNKLGKYLSNGYLYSIQKMFKYNHILFGILLALKNPYLISLYFQVEQILL